MGIFYNRVLLSCFLFLCLSWSKMIYGQNLHMKNVRIRNCGKKNAPIQIDQVTFHDMKDDIRTSLTLRATQNFCPPVKLTYRTHTAGAIPIPLAGTIKNIIPRHECPDAHDLNLPCRCPVLQGTTIIMRRILKLPFQFSSFKSFFKGEYQTRIDFSHLNTQIACYYLGFVIF